MDGPTTTPLIEAVLEGEAKIKLGGQAQEMIRREQIRELDDAQTEVAAAFEDLGFLTEPTARAELERVGFALDRARAAVDALWYLAPDDNRPLEEPS